MAYCVRPKSGSEQVSHFCSCGKCFDMAALQLSMLQVYCASRKMDNRSFLRSLGKLDDQLKSGQTVLNKCKLLILLLFLFHCRP
jgi:hypothetical protein